MKFRTQSKVLLPVKLKRSEEWGFELIQGETFPEVQEEKQTFGKTNTFGDFAKFSPFFDDTGIIKVLSTKHKFVKVLLRNLHLEHNHEGVEHVISVFQQMIWILGLQKVLSIKSSCVFFSQITCADKPSSHGQSTCRETWLSLLPLYSCW